MRVTPIPLVAQSRLQQVHLVTSTIVLRLSRRYHVKADDRIGRHIHINIAHAILSMMDQLDMREEARE